MLIGEIRLNQICLFVVFHVIRHIIDLRQTRYDSPFRSMNLIHVIDDRINFLSAHTKDLCIYMSHTSYISKALWRFYKKSLKLVKKLRNQNRAFQTELQLSHK